MLNKNTAVKSKPPAKLQRTPFHHQEKPLFAPSLENKLKLLAKSISPASKPLDHPLETPELTITTTTTTHITSNISFKPSASPILSRSNNTSSNPMINKQQITPNNSNKSLLNPQGNNVIIGNNVKKPTMSQQQSRSIGGTPDTFKQRKKYRDLEMPNQEPTKFSFKKNGLVKAYAVNTNQGIVRNYNEDRVSIILNIMKPIDRQDEYWPRCSFFGVYDGHGGVACADFLRDHLHQFVISNSNFPWNPKLALEGGFREAESEFLSKSYKINENNEVEILEKAGSCAIVILIIGDMCFIANVGDSRAVMSGENGDKIYGLSRDHKPMDEIEYQRISDAGGKIYQTKIQAYCNNSGGGVGTVPDNGYLVGPYRVLPGRLSVTRTFGDIEAKLLEAGGNPNVVIAKPDIRSFQITEDHDFVIVASDGIYDKLTNQEVIETVWNSAREKKGDNIHQACANAVEMIMKTAIAKRTVDNITVVMIGFSSFKYLLFPKRPDLIGNNSLDNINDYRNLHEIHRINNSFEYIDDKNNSKEFSLQLNLINQNNSQEKYKENEAKTPIQQSIQHGHNKSNHLIKKKINTSINNNISNNNPIKKKKEVSQERKGLSINKNTNFMGFNYNNNVTTAGGNSLNNNNNNNGQRVSVKKSENNLYSYRGMGKNIEKKK